MEKHFKPFVAEAIGTFMFIFIGAGSICIDAKMGFKGYGLLGIALAHGVMLSIAVTAFGHISGAHFNPAVTVAAFVGRKIGLLSAILYIFAQLAGGALAGFTLRYIFPEAVLTVHLGTPVLDEPNIDPLTGILIEAILTFILVTVIFATAIDPGGAFDKVSGFAIGLTVMMDILVGGPLTGAAMNPARHFGTAVAANYWENVHVYWIGPIVGGVVAALLYTQVFLKDDRNRSGK